MKIADMLGREDFYPILVGTLNQYFQFDDTTKLISQSSNKGDNFAYIYKHLNAVVAKYPDDKVKNYLLTEYRTRNIYKRIPGYFYLQTALRTGGFFADAYLSNSRGTELDRHILIYPCSKKIRIFNFKDNFVDVVVKNGFSNDLIAKEISFREKHHSPHFPSIISSTVNSYREEIIDGIPLARITDEKKYTELKYRSLEILKTEISVYEKSIDAKNYVEKLKSEFFKIIDGTGLVHLQSTYEELSRIVLREFNTIPVVLSHGDFHHGNIWVENRTNRIFIIDFETCEERSRFYDPYTLFHDLRSFDFHKTMLMFLNEGGSKITGNAKNVRGILALILIEDFLFKVKDSFIFSGNNNAYEEIKKNKFKMDMVIKELRLRDS